MAAIQLRVEERVANAMSFGAIVVSILVEALSSMFLLEVLDVTVGLL